MSETEQDRITEVRFLARQVNLPIPEACLPGVQANLALLRTHVDLVESVSLPDDCTPAYVFTP
ncbi:DUF4089 domain-containing protein [Acetobacter estunensis]|uniref:DUF4089 domain-containing protein n=1 Tax=Acetobacter estunensis TaxID=104097 RepID=UPI001C2DB6EE|nr:DUF4089 domain-containing protein [Acetobacter estunensis]MBV1836394.1 DUF4089 domain-containing protein [Acetobacter estunensis]